jgi:CheY-like chemotaxis protein
MYRILLVDDSRVMRKLLQNVLVSNGYADSEFPEASDGNEALQRLEQFSFKVDAIFCDLSMPNLDGLGFIDALAARKRLGMCPLIVLTADGSQSRGREVLLRGASALLRKPFNADEVSAVLGRLLASPRDASAGQP